ARFGRVLEALARDRLTLPVVPGTSHLTVGGAIAADVHGKNHPVAGSFGRQVRSLELLTPAGESLLASPEHESELFAATLGGMGLTGVICAATLRTIPLRTPYALADVERVEGLEQAIRAIAGTPHSHAIAWLDLLAPGRRFARGVVTCSREGGDAPEHTLRVGAGPRPVVPERVPGGLLRPTLMRAFNEALWQRAARPVRDRPMNVDAQLFPLDRIERWNNLYGPAGLIQYQFALPAGQERTLRTVLEMLRGARLPMYLATLKRLGASSGGLLSFPLPGWTLAIDFPAGAPGLAAALDRADELVAAAGGRVYLAKDARMRAEMLAAMYERLGEFTALRARVDPCGVLRSDLARRLGLSA
ncbi:MAG: FAD-binding protein, partial [Solirubrobacteraceae bacterium]